MKKLVLLFAFVSLSVAAYAQDDEYYFNDRTHEIETIEINEAGMKNHPYGEDIARKFQLLKDTYTWRDLGDATNPTERTVVEKPVLYYSFKKVDKYLKKQVKSGALAQNDAKDALVAVLEIGFSIRHQNTIAFEQAIRAAKSGDKILAIYESVVLK